MDNEKKVVSGSHGTASQGLAKKFGKRTLIILLIVSVMAIGLAYAVVRNMNSDKPVAKACSNKVIDQASMSLAPADVKKLGSVVTSVQKLPAYREDANCVYIELLYATNNNEVDRANTSLALFKKIPADKRIIDNRLLRGEYFSASQLEEQIKYLNILRAEGRKNGRNISQ